MRLFGKTFSQYLAFEKLPLALVLGVALLRLALSLAGVPNESVRWVSMTVAMIAAVVYLGAAVHTSGFGSYKQLLGCLWIQCVLAEAVPVLAIVLAMATGHDNIYTAPEFSPEADGKTWFHVFGHTLAAVVFLPLMSWAIGSLVMFVTKRLAPSPAQAR